MRRTLLQGLLALITLAAASPAGAQFDGAPRSGGSPKWWVSAWGGYQWADRVSDPASAADWLFDQSWSTRLTVEREVTPGIAAGLAYNYARIPLRFRNFISTDGGAGGSCNSCTGEATLASYGLTVRSGMGSRGFHLITEGFLGAIRYGNFELEESSPTVVAAREIANTDFGYAIGVGFGYALARDWQIVTLFETLNGIHERTDNLFGQRNSRHYSTRAGVRFGF